MEFLLNSVGNLWGIPSPKESFWKSLGNPIGHFRKTFVRTPQRSHWSSERNALRISLRICQGIPGEFTREFLKRKSLRNLTANSLKTFYIIPKRIHREFHKECHRKSLSNSIRNSQRTLLRITQGMSEEFPREFPRKYLRNSRWNSLRSSSRIPQGMTEELSNEFLRKSLSNSIGSSLRLSLRTKDSLRKSIGIL